MFESVFSTLLYPLNFIFGSVPTVDESMFFATLFDILPAFSRKVVMQSICKVYLPCVFPLRHSRC